jgi:hypothetical protein
MVEASIVNIVELGVLVVGVVIALQQLNDIKRTRETEIETRQADFLLRQTQLITDNDFQKSWRNVVWDQRFATQEEWLEKYGPTKNPEAYSNFLTICQYYNHLGILVMENKIPARLIIETVTPVIILTPWKRIEPIVKRWRMRYQDDTLLAGFELLVNMIQEIHPKMYNHITIPYE